MTRASKIEPYIREIRRAHKNGASYQDLADKYGVKYGVIAMCCLGYTFLYYGGHIKEPQGLITEEVVKIKRLLLDGNNHRSIADRFGVARSTVSRIARCELHSDIGMSEIEFVKKMTRVKAADDKAKVCTWNGVLYDTITDCANANSVSRRTMSRWLKKGWTCDDDIVRKVNQYT